LNHEEKKKTQNEHESEGNEEKKKFLFLHLPQEIEGGERGGKNPKPRQISYQQGERKKKEKCS